MHTETSEPAREATRITPSTPRTSRKIRKHAAASPEPPPKPEPTGKFFSTTKRRPRTTPKASAETSPPPETSSRNNERARKTRLSDKSSPDNAEAKGPDKVKMSAAVTVAVSRRLRARRDSSRRSSAITLSPTPQTVVVSDATSCKPSARREPTRKVKLIFGAASSTRNGRLKCTVQPVLQFFAQILLALRMIAAAQSTPPLHPRLA